MDFYLTAECPNCDETIYYGLCVTADEHNGRPAIPFDMAVQTAFYCDSCGEKSYTGDFDLLTEDEI